MKIYFFILIAPIVFIGGNIFVAITYVIKYIAHVTEKASHATFKWCDDWCFQSFNNIIKGVIEYYK